MTAIAAILLSIITQGAHPIAKGCYATDAVCIDEYDERVFTLAVVSTERLLCAQSTTPRTCRTAYDLVYGAGR